MEWIDCKERLPKLEEVVWLWNGTSPYIGCRSWVGEEEGWIWAVSYGAVYLDNGKITAECESDDDYNITHWQPLPSPPKTDHLK